MNSDPTIKAEFKLCDGKTYRRKTKIIFNNDNNACLGIVIMLNPGSCSPIKGEEIITEEWVELECEKDPTLEKVVACLEDSYCDKADGYVYIVNLSTLKNTKPVNLSIENFSKPSDVHDEIKRTIGNSKSHFRWIWVAFGYLDSLPKYWKNEETRIKVKSLKEDILTNLQQNYPNHIIGENIQFLHPINFRFPEKFEKQRITIIKDLKEKIITGT